MMWEKGEMLIARDEDDDLTLIKYEGIGLDEETFSGTVIASTYYDKDTYDECWIKDGFEIATKENTLKEWHKYLLDKFEREDIYFLNKEDIQILHKKLK